MKKDAELLQIHAKCETLEVRLKVGVNAANSPYKYALHEKDIQLDALVDQLNLMQDSTREND